MNEIKMEKVWPEWELIGKLGTGDFADVYLAKSTLDGGDAYSAVKVINMPPSADALESARKSGIPDDLLKTYFGKFKNDLMWELTMYRPLTGAGLAPVDAITAVDSDNAGWQGFIRTPLYTPMETYFEKVSATEEDAARLGSELCVALEKCEKHNVVHGEIKPENVMVADSGAFVLVDFGVRRCLEKAGAGIFGEHDTAYEAPEIGAEKRYTAASDIYSLGMVMAYVAAGCMMPPDINSDQMEDISPNLAKIIRKAAAANPTDRYASAAEMKDDIDALHLIKKAPRRTMAALAAFDMVKKNGGFIIQSEAPDMEKAKKEKMPRAPLSEKQKTGIITAIIALLALIAVIVSFAIRSNMQKEPDGNDTPPVSDGANVPDNGADDTPDDNVPDDSTDNSDDGTDAPDGNVPSDDESTVPDDGTDEPVAPPEDEPTVPDEPVTPPEDNPGVSLDSSYLFPSDTKLITAADLKGKSNWETSLMINEIYARHGMIFENKSTQKHFESKAWYTPVTNSYGQIEQKFNDTEWANVYFILDYQKGTDKPADDTPTNPEGGNTQPETPPETDTPTRPTPTNNDILFPSDTKLITEADLAGKTRSESYMLINEIYARHGKMFDTKSVQDYFDSQIWYTPVSKSYAKAEAGFNDTEWTNLYAIIDYQKAQGFRN